jgi:vancomycin permeability regulator SanA
LFILKLTFKFVKFLIYLIIFSALLFFFYHSYGVYSSSKVQSVDKTDAIIVLGAAQFNGEPSPVFKSRLDHALELFNNNVSKTIITVGGKQKGDKFTEAEAGKNYLAQFIPKENIYSIKDGKDTLESFQLIREKYPDLNKVTLVSDPAHLWRSKLMAEDLNFEVFLSSTTQGPGSKLTIKYLIREFISITKYQLNKFNIQQIEI